MEFIALTKTSGILRPIADVLGIIMDWLFKLTSHVGIFNIGLCIILFTLVVKLLMFPLTFQQQKSSKLTALMQPELQAIQKKYKGKKDNESMMKMQVETRAVYEKYGTSMTGGCLQLLIQTPILFALYRVIYNIPAYVSSVRMYFDNVVTPVQGQPDFINKISDLANACSMPVDKFDYNVADKLVDLFYKFSPEQWGQLKTAFPALSDTITTNSLAIEKMNSFFGLNLSVSPWNTITGAFNGKTAITAAVVALIIPLLAGLSQWYSAKLMTANQPTANQESSAAQQMAMMNKTMPLMSVFFCFTFATGIGIYWIASSVLQIGQQLIVNHHIDKIDMDEMIKKNLEKANAKRAKKGLPPEKINTNAVANLKNLQANEAKEQQERQEKIKQTQEYVKESNEYYNSNAKPGSLAAKAAMVQKFNEKNNNK